MYDKCKTKVLMVMTKKAFISYSHKDAELLAKLDAPPDPLGRTVT
jgi:hypothetical protein